MSRPRRFPAPIGPGGARRARSRKTRRFLTPIEAGGAAFGLETGGKAGNVLRCAGLPGIDLPRSSVLVAGALEHFIERSFSKRAFVAMVDAYLSGGRRGEFFARLAHAPFPPTLEEEIVSGLSGTGLVIVRSSGTREDAGATSLAGHYESIVSRTERRELLFTVKSCWLVGLRVYLDLLAAGSSAREAAREAPRSLALLIQDVVPAQRSGVYFSQSPLHPSRALVTANWGTCHSAVDGTMANDMFVLRNGRLDARTVRHKFEMTVFSDLEKEPLPGEEADTPLGRTVVHFPMGNRLYSARVPPPLDGAPALEKRHLEKIARAAGTLKAHLGYEIDMEWSFAGERLFVLQVRPITTAPPEEERAAEEGEHVIASPGVAQGPVRIVLSPDDIAKVRKGDIIAVKATDPDFMPILYRAAGIAAEDGSPLCHTAIVARELGIPCILGVARATSGAFVEGEIVVVDADRGRITRAEGEARAVRERPFRRNGVVYDVGHLGIVEKGAAPVIALSALLHGFFRRSRWADPTVERLREYAASLRERHGLGSLALHWDVDDRGSARAEADLHIAALRAAAERGEW